MKEICVQYAGFNKWASERLLRTTLQLTESQLQTELKSSFSNIHSTWLHMWDAESVWYQRVKLAEQIQLPNASKPNMKAVAEGVIAQGQLWKDHLSNLPEHAFSHVIAYRNTKKEEFKQPLWQIVMHTINHATYHRGQIVTMLRELGVNEIPSTDFIEFTRRGNKG